MPAQATTVEQEQSARARLPKAKGAALVLKLEDDVERLADVRKRCGDELSLLRASGALGGAGGQGRGQVHGAVLEAAVAVAQDDELASNDLVAKGLRKDVDAHVATVRRQLRRADGGVARREERAARDAYVPRPPPQRGSGFSERRKPAPKKRPAFHGAGHNERDRAYEDVLVLPRRQDGLAVKRPGFMKAPAPQPRQPRTPRVSRHCHAHQPSAADLAALQL